MANKNQIRIYLNIIRRAASLLEAELDKDGGSFEELFEQEKTVSKPQIVEQKLVAPKIEKVEIEEPIVNRQNYIDNLMSMDSWPEIMPQHLIVTPNDEDQKHRASSVLDMILNESIEGLNCLDYGCGEGWITKEFKKRGAKEAVGYDLQKDEKWESFTGIDFVTSVNDLPKKHFDIILLYDVLDHCVDTESVMNNILMLLKDTGVVYVRCHPWTSKHATHLIKQGLNKAYIHMFLSWSEIESLTGKKPVFTRKEKDPMRSYMWWFRDFKVEKQTKITEPVSDFFKNKEIKDMLSKEQDVSNIEEFLKNMSLQFVDFKLRHK